MGVFEEHAFPGDAVDVGRLDQVVDRALAIELLIQTGVAAHVIGKAEDNVRLALSGGSGVEQGTQKEKRKKTHGEGR